MKTTRFILTKHLWSRFTAMGSDAVALTGRGRLPRDLYWLGILGVVLCNVCFSYALGTGGAPPSPPAALASIVILWSWAVLFIRRGHDLGITGFATIAATALLLVACFELVKHFQVTAIALQVTYVVLFGLVPGTPGPNRYGPPPKRRG